MGHGIESIFKTCTEQLFWYATAIRVVISNQPWHQKMKRFSKRVPALLVVNLLISPIRIGICSLHYPLLYEIRRMRSRFLHSAQQSVDASVSHGEVNESYLRHNVPSLEEACYLCIIQMVRLFQYMIMMHTMGTPGLYQTTPIRWTFQNHFLKTSKHSP